MLSRLKWDPVGSFSYQGFDYTPLSVTTVLMGADKVHHTCLDVHQLLTTPAQYPSTKQKEKYEILQSCG